MTTRTPQSRTTPLTRRISVVAALSAAAIGGAVIDTPRLQAVAGGVASSVVAVEPTRVLDTRFGTGLPGDLSANQTNNLQITGSIETRQGDDNVNETVVPIGATGVLLNVTALRPQAGGFFSIRPGSATGEPNASNLNFAAGSIIPNAVTVALPSSGPGVGSIDIWYGSGTPGATTGALIDVVGYTIEADGSGTPGPPGPQGDTGAAGVDAFELDNVVTVSASGADFTDPAAAMASITDASATNPYVVLVGPGEYPLSSTLTITSFVHLQGSGRRVTTMTGTSNSGSSGVVGMSSDVSLTDMTIESTSTTGGSQVIVGGLFANRVELARLDLIAQGNAGTQRGLYHRVGSVTLTDSTIVLESTDPTPTQIGVYSNFAGSFIDISNTRIAAATDPINFSFGGNTSARCNFVQTGTQPGGGTLLDSNCD